MRFNFCGGGNKNFTIIEGDIRNLETCKKLKHNLNNYSSILITKPKVRWPAKTARVRWVNLNLLDWFERALATFNYQSYKFKERVEASFWLVFLLTFSTKEKVS